MKRASSLVVARIAAAALLVCAFAELPAAAEPVAPAFGGKLNRTIARLRSARSERRSATSLATLPASASARSGHACISRVSADGGKAHRRPQPVQGSPEPSARPPNTLGSTAPSSSGIATIIVASRGSRPWRLAPHCWSDWNSIGCAAT